MEMRLDQQKPPEVSAEQRASNELVKLIRKLRWMGMEEEVERARDELSKCHVPATDTGGGIARDGLTPYRMDEVKSDPVLAGRRNHLV
jgi:hypothetical protein